MIERPNRESDPSKAPSEVPGAIGVAVTVLVAFAMPLMWFSILIGLIPAFIAKGKGRSFTGWWFFGSWLWIVALPVAAIMKPDPNAEARRETTVGKRRCPHCAEWIMQQAVVCRYCSRDVPPPERPKPRI